LVIIRVFAWQERLVVNITLKEEDLDAPDDLEELKDLLKEDNQQEESK